MFEWWRQAIADEQAKLATERRGSQARAVISSPEASLTEPSPRPSVSTSAAGAAPIVSTGAAIAWHTPQSTSGRAGATPSEPGSLGPGTATADGTRAAAKGAADTPSQAAPVSEPSIVPDVLVEADPRPLAGGSAALQDAHSARSGNTARGADGAKGVTAGMQAAAAEGTPVTPRRMPVHSGTSASATGTRPSQLRHSRLLSMTPQANAMATGSYASPGRSRSWPSAQSTSPSDAARRGSGNNIGAGLAATTTGPAWQGVARQRRRVRPERGFMWSHKEDTICHNFHLQYQAQTGFHVHIIGSVLIRSELYA